MSCSDKTISLNNGLKCKVGDAGYQTASGEDSEGFKGEEQTFSTRKETSMLGLLEAS